MLGYVRALSEMQLLVLRNPTLGDRGDKCLKGGEGCGAHASLNTQDHLSASAFSAVEVFQCLVRHPVLYLNAKLASLMEFYLSVEIKIVRGICLCYFNFVHFTLFCKKLYLGLCLERIASA